MKNGQKLLEILLRKRHISGFNRSFSAFDFSHNPVLVLSNLHETLPYREAVMEDLKERGYPNQEMSVDVKKRKGFTRWDLEYRIRDDEGKLLAGLRIKEKDKYLNLEEIPTGTIEEAGFSEEYVRSLIGINDAYEIRIQSSNHEAVLGLARLFLDKTNPRSPRAWPDAYGVPVVFLLGTEIIEGFTPVTMYQQRRKRDNLSFVQRNVPEDIEKVLEENGFEQGNCLANSLFVRRCCNQ